MTADDELVISSLAMLGDGALDDAELDRRVTRFQGALRRLRDDPAEAARIDALVMDAERGKTDHYVVDSIGHTIYVNGGVVNVYGGRIAESADSRMDETTAAEEPAEARPAGLAQEIEWLHDLLGEGSAREQPRPRRPWETLLRPAFGGGILVAVLAAGTATLALHASAAAVSIMGIILAAAAAVTALLSVIVPWTSVRALNRRGDSRTALDLMLCGSLLKASTRRTSHLSYKMLAEALLAEAAKRAHSAESADSRETGTTRKVCATCGSQLTADDLFCGACGARGVPSVPRRAPSVSPTPRPDLHLLEKVLSGLREL